MIPRQAELSQSIPLKSPIVFLVYERFRENLLGVRVRYWCHLLNRKEAVKNLNLHSGTIVQDCSYGNLYIPGADLPVGNFVANGKVWLTISK